MPRRLIDIDTALADLGAGEAHPANEVLFSAASILEIAIKAGLGHADFAVRPEAIAQAARDTGFGELNR